MKTIRLFFYTIRLPADSLIASADRIRKIPTSCYPVFLLINISKEEQKETERILMEQKGGQKNNDENSPTEVKDRRSFPHRG